MSAPTHICPRCGGTVRIPRNSTFERVSEIHEKSCPSPTVVKR